MPHTALGRRRQTAPLQLLSDEHRALRGLFGRARGMAGDVQQRSPLLVEIGERLRLHVELQRRALYPALRRAMPELHALLDAAEVEQDVLLELAQRLQQVEPGQRRGDALLSVLSAYFDQHVRLVEEQVLPRVRQAPLDLTVLSRVLLERRAQLLRTREPGFSPVQAGA